MKITKETINRNVITNLESIRSVQKSESEILLAICNCVEPIDFHAINEIAENEKISKQTYIITVVDNLLNIVTAGKWDLTTYNSIVYLYNGCRWVAVKDDTFKRFLRDAAIKMGMPIRDAKYYKTQDELYKQFLASARLPVPPTKEESILINLQNGTYEIKSECHKFRGFSKSDFLRYQLPFSYDKDAECPKFQKMLDYNLPDKNCQSILAEYVGYIFTNNLKLEKVLILYGDGANGKSVIFDIITALLGRENICSYSLQNLTGREGYQRAELSNKLLNYSSEITTNKIDCAMFKALASGEPVEARYIYGRAFIIEHYAKLMFNCNLLPSNVELTSAFFRRFLIIPFDVTIPETKQDPNLANNIIATELPGILNWALKGLDRLLSQKHFTQSEKVTQVSEEYKHQSDSVGQFIEERGYCPGFDHQILSSELYSAYSSYCRCCNLPAVAMASFGGKLEKLGFYKHKKNTGRYFYYSFINHDK